MNSIETEAAEYILWLRVHNYAETTIAARVRYLSYFVRFCSEAGVQRPDAVTFELIQGYQTQLFEYRKRDGRQLTVATQAQRLVPIAHFFSWLRRTGRLATNPAGDLLMPKPDRRLPEATLTRGEMTLLLATPDLSKPLGLRDRAVLEVFYSCALRRAELIALTVRDVDFDRGTVFVRSGKGAKDRYVPIGERDLFWVRLYLKHRPARVRHRRTSRPALPIVRWHPDLPRLALPPRPTLPRSNWHREARQLSSAQTHRCHADARGRCGHPLRRRNARSRQTGDDPALHARQHRPSPPRPRDLPPRRQSQRRHGV
jgi:site-specific recombinase XerD